MLRADNIRLLPVVLVCSMLLAITNVRELQAEPLDAAIAQQAYAVAESWMEDLQVPDSAPVIEAKGAAAAHITIRFEGIALGSATQTLDNPLAPITQTQPTDVMALVRPAMSQAITDAQRGLKVIAAKPGNHNLPKDLATLAPLLKLEIAIARAPQRIRLHSREQLLQRFKPALHGLALRHDDRWAWSFPNTVVATNPNLNAQLLQLLAGVELGVEHAAKIGQTDGPLLYRFSVVHVVRPAADQPVVVLHRGGQPLPPVGLTGEQIDTISLTWANHLIRRQSPTGHFKGTYHPTGNRYHPEQALNTNAALACYALARFSKQPHLDEATRIRCRATARQGLNALLTDMGVAHGSGITTGPVQTRQHTGTVAMTLLTLLELPDQDGLTLPRDRLAGMLVMAIDDTGLVRSTDHPDSPPDARSNRSLTALAMVRLYAHTRDEQYLNRAQLILKRIWAESEQAPAKGIGPWLAMAEMELSDLDRGTLGLIGVRQLCDRQWSRQVRPFGPTASDDPDSPDYVSPDTFGGFRSDAHLYPEPTWLSALPTAALAVVLGTEGMVAEEQRFEWMMNGSLALRFLSQLTMRTEDAYYAHPLTETVGGVRAAPWDNRQPLGATAMALLAATEFKLSIEK